MVSREEAFRLLDARLRPLRIALIAGLAASPVAVVVLQARALLRTGGVEGGVLSLLPATVFWTVVCWAILGAAGLLLVRRARGRIATARALIEAGTAQAGELRSTAHSSRQAAGVQMNKRTATLRTADGEEHTAAIEEPVGTDLPALSPGAEATVWVSDRGVAAVIGDAVLTSEP